MEPSDLIRIRLGSPVWVWVVRFGRGRWWPGTVEGVRTQDRLPLLKVRFECTENGKSDRHVMVGLITTRMRYIESRDLNIKSIDRPQFTPISLLQKPESGERYESESSGCSSEPLESSISASRTKAR